MWGSGRAGSAYGILTGGQNPTDSCARSERMRVRAGESNAERMVVAECILPTGEYSTYK